MARLVNLASFRASMLMAMLDMDNISMAAGTGTRLECMLRWLVGAVQSRVQD